MTVEVSKLSAIAVMHRDQQLEVSKLSAIAVMHRDQQLEVSKLSLAVVFNPPLAPSVAHVIVVT